MATSATSDNLALDYRKHHLRRPSADDFDQTNEFRHHDYDDDDDDIECAGNIVIVEKGRIVTAASKKALPMKAQLAQPKAPLRMGRNDKISAPTSSPIKRSSSFSVKAAQQQVAPPPPVTPKMVTKTARGSAIQKSASSTSFRKLLHYDEDEMEFYGNRHNAAATTNAEIDYSSETSEDEDDDDDDKEPITNTRYNKAFLMRVEQSKKAIADGPKTKLCPNTPEMSRRDMNMRRDRASMPRDASLNRLKQDLNSFSSAKKHLNNKEMLPSKDAAAALASNSNNKTKVLPKYLDISKYKAPQGNTFLKKDETKSYLLQKTEVKRSPSSASVLMTRSDPSRASTRSVKSAGSKPSLSKKVDPQGKQCNF